MSLFPSTFTVILFVSLIVFAQGSRAGDLGSTGLVTLPTARMQADGSLTATLARNEVVDIYNVTFQATPLLRRHSAIRSSTPEGALSL